MLLALSFIQPPAAGAAAAFSVSDADWTNNQTGATGLPCVHTTGTNSCATVAHAIDNLSAGSQISGTISITAGTATTIELRVRCIDAASVVNLLTKSYAHTSGAATDYQFLFTIAESTNCAIFDLAVVTPVSASFTLGTATSVTVTPPNPDATAVPPATAAPVPTTTPPPTTDTGGTAGADPSEFPYTSDCWHGLRTEPGVNTVKCEWWGSQGRSLGGGEDDLPGNQFVDGRWRGSPGIVGAVLGDEFKLRLTTIGLGWDIRAKFPIPVGVTSVHLGWGINYGDAPVTHSGTGRFVGVFIFYDGSGAEVGRGFKLTAVMDEDPDTMGTDTYNVPAGAVSMTFGMGCLDGTICSGFYDTSSENRYIRVDNVALGMFFGATGADPVPPTDCEHGVITMPGHTNMCDLDWIIDPNSLLPVCGLLSGDCDKPFIAPAYVPQCFTPTDALDAVGWLAYIGCLVGVMPAVIWNVAIGAVNAIIDLVIPARLDDSWDYMIESFTSRAVFAWIAPLGAAWQEAAVGYGGTPAVDFATVTFMGQDVDMAQMLSDAMDHVAPYRGVLLGLVALGIMLRMRNKVLGALGSTTEERL